MRPTEAVERHARAVLTVWVLPEEAPAVVAGFREYEPFLHALSAAGVDPLNDGPRARFLLPLAVAVQYGRAEAEVLTALWDAAAALADVLDIAAVAQDRLRRLAELVSRETEGGTQ